MALLNRLPLALGCFARPFEGGSWMPDAGVFTISILNIAPLSSLPWLVFYSPDAV